ncbi:uncharacterized protein LOC109512837 isoform X2 [Hippocampus comes]|uniref:uncharacterized protein LOC109512837 isoform X2 n=1 Tax=Hippocampus comes TaxID=109280 RepID=UPI00094E6D6B|nr:PREDICTED: uncharacterized protein LOC109512837 isoform X2 [Hippocampus comes]
MSVNLPDLAPKTGEKGNAVMCNGKASTTCPLPAVFTGPTKSHAHKTLDDKLVPYRKSGDYRLKLPPINENPKTYELSTNLTIKDLKRQNGNLQLQLVVFKTQSKVMKNVLHRHTVAVQEYQRLEGSLSQIQDQHINEVKAMRKLLGKTRSSCDTLAKKLQESEKELLDSKDKILQLESHIFNNPTMLEKEELSRRLDEATVNLKEKNKRIWELEKNNKLLQSTLHRHIAGEQRKLSKTNDVFFSLQARVYELTREIRERKKELEDHNIPTLRFEHSANKKEMFNKMVQTEETIPITNGNAYSFRSGSAEPDDGIQQWLRSTSTDHVPGGSLAVRYLKTKRNVEVPKKCTDFQEIPTHQMAGDHIESKEVTNASQESMEEELDEDWIRKQKCPGSCRFAQTIVKTPPQQKGHKRTQFRRKYVFSPVTTNLHLGKPAYSGLDRKSRESLTRRQAPTWKSEEEDTPQHDFQNSQPDLDPSDSSLVDSFESPRGTYSWR